MTRPASTAPSAEKSGSDAVTITANETNDVSHGLEDGFSQVGQDEAATASGDQLGYQGTPNTPATQSDPEEAEGGALAWLQVAGCFCLYWNSL